MGPAIGSILPMAIGVAISPVPINNATVMTMLFVVFGAVLVGQGFGGLTE